MTKIVFPAIDKKSKETQAKMVERFNTTVLQNEFPEGAKVMTLDPIHAGKLNPRYEGPYTVVCHMPEVHMNSKMAQALYLVATMLHLS